MFQSILKNGRLWRFLLVMALLPGLFAWPVRQFPAAPYQPVPEPIFPAGPQLALLRWPENLQAVRYELEIFSYVPDSLDPRLPVDTVLYRNDELYGNQLLLDEKQLPGLEEEQPLFWRVRPLDMEGAPIGAYSSVRELRTSSSATTAMPGTPPAAKPGPVPGCCIRCILTPPCPVPSSTKWRSWMTCHSIWMGSCPFPSGLCRNHRIDGPVRQTAPDRHLLLAGAGPGQTGPARG